VPADGAQVSGRVAFTPAPALLRVTILMIPDVPSAVNFAEGLVMTSIFSMLAAGSC